MIELESSRGGKVRNQLAGKGFIHSQDPRGPTTVGHGAGTAPDRLQLLDRPIHRTPLPEIGRGRSTPLAPGPASRHISRRTSSPLLETESDRLDFCPAPPGLVFRGDVDPRFRADVDHRFRTHVDPSFRTSAGFLSRHYETGGAPFRESWGTITTEARKAPHSPSKPRPTSRRNQCPTSPGIRKLNVLASRPTTRALRMHDTVRLIRLIR